MLIEQWDIVWIWHGEWMVGSHQALLLVAPLEEREVNNPETLEYVLVAQAKALTHLKSQRAELDTGLVGIVATQDQYQVSILGTHHGLDLSQLLWSIELIDATLDSTISIILDVNQSLGTYLWTLHEIGQFIKLLAAIVSASRNADTTDILSLIEYGEDSLALESFLEFYKLHAEAQVWLIATEAAHSIMPCHLLQLRQFYATDFLKQVACHLFEKIDDIILVYETHLAVNLCKLWLTVSTEVLITEALGNLEVAVETSYHQKLLQGLRALRKCIELSWVHTGRNHEVAGTLWSTTDEDRSLNLHEVLAVEEITDEDAHTVAQLQVLAYGRATQVEVTILHTDIITTISIIFDSERRSLALREHVEFLHQDFNITGIHLRILALSLAYCTLNLDAVFTTQLVSCIAQVLVIGLIEDQLCDTITVAQVNECHTTHLSCALYPSGKSYLFACIRETKLSTSITSVHTFILYIFIYYNVQSYDKKRRKQKKIAKIL